MTISAELEIDFNRVRTPVQEYPVEFDLITSEVPGERGAELGPFAQKLALRAVTLAGEPRTRAEQVCRKIDRLCMPCNGDES